MSKAEIDSFLSKPLVARVATIRDDGYPHVTPLWYHWDGEHLYLILGHGERPRHHIANLRRNDKVTLVIDKDVRPDTKTLFEAQNRVIVKIKPEKIIAWNFEKLDSAYGSKKKG